MIIASDLWDIRPSLIRYAMSLTRKHDWAEDLVQDTMVKALTYQDKFIDQGPGALRAWTFIILHNLFITQKRRSHRMIYTDEVFQCIQLPNQQHHVELQDTLANYAQLHPSHKRALAAILDGQTYEQHAKAEGVPLGTIKSRMRRARQALHAMDGEA